MITETSGFPMAEPPCIPVVVGESEPGLVPSILFTGLFMGWWALVYWPAAAFLAALMLAVWALAFAVCRSSINRPKEKAEVET